MCILWIVIKKRINYKIFIPSPVNRFLRKCWLFLSLFFLSTVYQTYQQYFHKINKIKIKIVLAILFCRFRRPIPLRLRLRRDRAGKGACRSEALAKDGGFERDRLRQLADGADERRQKGIAKTVLIYSTKELYIFCLINSSSCLSRRLFSSSLPIFL